MSKNTTDIKYIGAGEIEISVGNYSERFKSTKVSSVDSNFATHLLEREDFILAENGFPKNFPGATNFEAAGISLEKAEAMSEEELLKVPGIGEATAGAIIALRSEQ